ncbi:hypothetical protein LCGC14_1723200 [marine sediment metagenome]|uniref:Uncharacterized protein n=1 Tax=marine sediment metagenome TaxID=412755 RepID=A0A0F9JSA2_9ZZZZ
MTKQYLRKREYLGEKLYHYHVKYGNKIVKIIMKWISGEYRITSAKPSKVYYFELEFPYKRTVGTIDRIEELLRE